MNYYFVERFGDGRPDTPLYKQEFLEGDRPVLNQEIHIKGKSYTVIAVSPPTNPADAAVTYYVNRTNPNYPYKR